jgi:hypothetical protein
MSGADLTALLAAAEPASPKPLGSLIDRLEAEGRMRGAREGGQAIGAARAVAPRDPRSCVRLAAGRPGSLFVAVPSAHG